MQWNGAGVVARILLISAGLAGGGWPLDGRGMEAESQTFDVPYLADVTLDGDDADWRGRGLSVEALKPVGRDAVSVTNFNSSFKLGWNDEGLLVAALIRDDVWLEDPEKPWRLDSLELFLASEVGGRDVAQWIVLSGMAGDAAGASVRFQDHRASEALRSLPAEARVVRRRVAADTCHVELLLPWSALGIDPTPGDTVGFQLWFNDADRADCKDALHIAWYEGLRTFRLTNNMHCLRLVTNAGPAELLYPTGRLDAGANVARFYLTGDAALAGGKVTVTAGGREVAAAMLAADGYGRASTRVAVPLPPYGAPAETLTVRVDNRYATRLGLSDYDRQRAQRLDGIRFTFTAETFETDVFPGGAFKDPGAVSNLLGPHAITIAYYDATFQPCTRAALPGRYGAVVSVRAASGAMLYRYAALHRGAADAAAETAVGFPPTVFDDLWWSELKARYGCVNAPYRSVVVMPQGYEADPARRWPLMIFLHGGGLVGGSFERFRREALPEVLLDGRLPYVTLMPHSYGYWNADAIRDMIDEARHRYRIDPARIYVTGHSLGAKGVAEFAGRYPQRVAAAVMMGGGGGKPAAFRNTPTWMFFGEHEAANRVASGRYLIDGLLALGADQARLIIVPGEGHGVERKALALPELHAWLASCSRPMPDFAPAPVEPRE